MKKIMLIALIVIAFGLIDRASADTPLPFKTHDESSDLALLSTKIDGIDVPYDVLMYAQTEYQGYAITQASKITHNNRQVYSLRVDRDSLSGGSDSFYLLYDMNWQLIGKQKVEPAPPPPVEIQQPKEETKPPDPEPVAPAPDPQTQPPPEPAPEPQPQPQPEPAPPPTEPHKPH